MTLSNLRPHVKILTTTSLCLLRRGNQSQGQVSLPLAWVGPSQCVWSGLGFVSWMEGTERVLTGTLLPAEPVSPESVTYLSTDVVLCSRNVSWFGLTLTGSTPRVLLSSGGGGGGGVEPCGPATLSNYERRDGSNRGCAAPLPGVFIIFLVGLCQRRQTDGFLIFFSRMI